MSLRHTLSMLSLFLFATLPLAAGAAPKYAVTVVGIAGSSATGINASGAVIGNQPSGANTHAFVHHAGVITDLGALGVLNSRAAGINKCRKDRRQRGRWPGAQPGAGLVAARSERH